MEDLKTIETVDQSPFKRMCMTIGELPASFVDSMTYYECLAWLVNYLEKTVIPAVNNNAEAVEELQAYYVELRHWFDNLDVQDEINNKLDEMADSGELAEIIATYAATKVDYFYIDSNSTSSDIVNAFASEKSKVIEFETGTYTVTNDIILTSNTIVNLNGATLSATTQKMYGYALDSTYTVYNGVHNVEFNNGKIDICIALMHNTNIAFNNIEFLPKTTHLIQIAGCDNVKIDSCVFDGVIIDDEASASFETVQIENCNASGQPWLDPSSVSYDYTPCKNILIQNNTFKKGDGINTCYYTAIGNHSNNADYPKQGENILVLNNYFEEGRYSSLCPNGWYKATIKGNKFIYDVNKDNTALVIKFRYENENVIIAENEFVGGWAHIYNVNARVCNNLLIKDNTFKTDYNNDGGASVTIRGWDNVVIENNQFLTGKKCYVIINDPSITGYTGSNYTIRNNYFDTTGLVSTSEIHAVDLRFGTNFKLLDNYFNCADNKYCYYIDASCIAYVNVIDDKYSRQGASYKISGSRGNINIYNIQREMYSGAAAYAALTNQTLSGALSDFNTLYALVHANGAPSTMNYVKIMGWGMGSAFSGSRSYPVTLGDKIGTLTLNSDGTITYTSSDSLTLRKLYGVNEKC